MKDNNPQLRAITNRSEHKNTPAGRQEADEVPIHNHSIGHLLFKKRILVTGGTGTIGQEIVRQLLTFQPEVVRIYSRDESKQFRMEQELGERRNVRFFIGDVRDAERLKMAMHEIDYIFHTAALKHVKSCEYNPFEAVKTNIFGTQNIILAALEGNVEKVILTSSDKAVNPSNAMGASKLMAERLMTAAHCMRGSRRTVFSSVRFGNVMGSRGSVVPLFADQIRQGGPVTITHPAMTRFIMSLQQAVELLLKSFLMARGGEVFTLRMPSVRIRDLAAVMISMLSKDRPVKMRRVGVKPGEKLFEELLTAEELQRSEMLEDLFVTYPTTSNGHSGSFGGTRPPRRSYSSSQNGLMDAGAIRRFLLDQSLIEPSRAAAACG